jgi:spore coat polysaccharide biosynthesis protein SpsF
MIPEVVSLIQARMSSSRLPGKVLLPLGDSTVLHQVARRAAQFSSQVVVCASDDPSDDKIEVHCSQLGLLCIRGALDDVYSRFLKALNDPRVLRSSWFCRITADSPLISVDLASRLVAEATDRIDYIGATLHEMPLGVAVELVNRRTFEDIDGDGLDSADREHVTLHLYEHAERYRCLRVTSPAELRHPELRLTLDYNEDYRVLREIFEQFREPTAEAAVAHLLSHPELARTNRECVQKPVRPET